MERPTDETAAWFDAAVPEDPRAKRGSMFAHPCATVNGNLFFGTFAQRVILRLGKARVDALAKKGPGAVFEPRPGKFWPEYLQLTRGAIPVKTLTKLATEALEYTAALPAKKKPQRKPPPRRR